MENSPEEKHLQTTSFVVHATRGVIREQNTRRKAMLFLLGLALLLLISGFTIFQPALNPREHPWRVIFFWIACIWLTFTALLLALFDLLVLRLQARRAGRELGERLDAARRRHPPSQGSGVTGSPGVAEQPPGSTSKD
jgi:hypothetical protein